MVKQSALPPPSPLLTGKELLLLQLLARGYSMSQVALLLRLSRAEALTLCSDATGALGQESCAGAIALARQRGLIF